MQTNHSHKNFNFHLVCVISACISGSLNGHTLFWSRHTPQNIYMRACGAGREKLPATLSCARHYFIRAWFIGDFKLVENWFICRLLCAYYARQGVLVPSSASAYNNENRFGLLQRTLWCSCLLLRAEAAAAETPEEICCLPWGKQTLSAVNSCVYLFSKAAGVSHREIIFVQ